MEAIECNTEVAMGTQEAPNLNTKFKIMAESRFALSNQNIVEQTNLVECLANMGGRLKEK